MYQALPLWLLLILLFVGGGIALNKYFDLRDNRRNFFADSEALRALTTRERVALAFLHMETVAPDADVHVLDGDMAVYDLHAPGMPGSPRLSIGGVPVTVHPSLEPALRTTANRAEVVLNHGRVLVLVLNGQALFSEFVDRSADREAHGAPCADMDMAVVARLTQHMPVKDSPDQVELLGCADDEDVGQSGHAALLGLGLVLLTPGLILLALMRSWHDFGLALLASPFLFLGLLFVWGERPGQAVGKHQLYRLRGVLDTRDTELPSSTTPRMRNHHAARLGAVGIDTTPAMRTVLERRHGQMVIIDVDRIGRLVRCDHWSLPALARQWPPSHWGPSWIGCGAALLLALTCWLRVAPPFDSYWRTAATALLLLAGVLAWRGYRVWQQGRARQQWLEQYIATDTPPKDN